MSIFENYFAHNACNLKNINEAITKVPEEFIDYVESKFRNEIKRTVDYIVKKQPECKILMVAGPSSSGKTTTANMIKDELKNRDIWSTVVSLDDFYVGVAKLPLLEDGSKDFESVNGLNLIEIQKCLSSILFNHICDMPIYDFSKMAPSGKRRKIEVPENGIIIIEGLHALNPIMLENLPVDSIIKIYVSVRSEIILDNGESILSESIRMTRRVIRDYNFRFTSPIATLEMWKNVCKGEQLYIKPFKKNSDIFINSFHAYEICVMAKEMLNLILSISKNDKTYSLIKDLISKLQKFKEVDSSLVPKTSLLREFIK